MASSSRPESDVWDALSASANSSSVGGKDGLLDSDRLLLFGGFFSASPPSVRTFADHSSFRLARGGRERWPAAESSLCPSSVPESRDERCFLLGSLCGWGGRFSEPPSLAHAEHRRRGRGQLA